MPPTIDPARLSEFERRPLSSGNHDSPADGTCVMEATAYVAGEPHSDHPACACPVLTAFCVSLNDSWNDADRQRLKPFVPRLVGTRSTPEVKTRRGLLTLDWTLRVHRPLWLDAAGLSEHAASMRALPEIVDEATSAAALKAQAAAIDAAWAAWDASAASAAWAASAASAAWAARAASAAWAARAASAASAARAAWAARAVWDARAAIPLLVAARAGDALGPDATETQRREAGIAALDTVAAAVRTTELELLDRMIEVRA